uniref:Uncharacterized protein n=1 Tax=Anguilla anguilla TaxID=7936 RepID=A0A0E9W466_ANGAN
MGNMSWVMWVFPALVITLNAQMIYSAELFLAILKVHKP